MDTKQFMAELLNVVPAIGGLYGEHESEFDELLPHVLLGEITRWTIELVGQASTGHKDAEATVKTILNELELGMRLGNMPIQELIAVSFLENLEAADRRANWLIARLGPTLARELQKMRNSVAGE